MSGDVWTPEMRAKAYAARDEEIASLRRWREREIARLKATSAPNPRIPLPHRAPALCRWAEMVLTSTTRRAPLERAAAYEVAALAYQMAGEPTLAAEARADAARVLGVTITREGAA